MTITIRPYEAADGEQTLDVFLRAIRVTASKDYTPVQIAAWTAGVDPAAWSRRRSGAGTWVAELEGNVVGFTDIDAVGYIDMMFVDPAVGRSGIATALLEHVQAIATSQNLRELTVNASKTARPFFERNGFTVAAEQQVERNGSTFTNYRMAAPLSSTEITSDWLPREFSHPLHVEWGEGIHLRPIRASDVDIDMRAVMENQEMLWGIYGEAWGWPPATMTAAQDVEDLQRHADEMERHESFNYAILPADESELYGCLYIDPVVTRNPSSVEAEVSWWLTERAPSWLKHRIAELASTWIRTAWPFTAVRTPFNTVAASRRRPPAELHRSDRL
jgi:GNAT superfamily N-acetyltransferase